MENIKPITSKTQSLKYRLWTPPPYIHHSQLQLPKNSGKKYPKPNDGASVIRSSAPAQQSLPSPAPAPAPALAIQSLPLPSPKRPASSTSSDAAPPTKRRRVSHYQNAATPQPVVRQPTTSYPVGSRPVELQPAPVATAQRKVPESPAITLISQIVKWKMEDIQSRLKMSNDYDGRHLNRQEWKKAQLTLVEELVWGKLESDLKATSIPKTFVIKGIPEVVAVTGTDIKYLNCKCEVQDNGYSLRTGTVVEINLLLDGQRPEKFLGYITEYERNYNIVKFEMIVSMQYQNHLSHSANVQIEASCNVRKLIETCDEINMASQFKLLRGIINPYNSIYSGKKRRRWMNPVSLYESVLRAYGTRNGFVTMVNRKGDLMEKLVHLVIKLIAPNENNNNRKYSILITGLSVNDLAKKLAERGIYEIEAPFEFKANRFLRFNENYATFSNDYKSGLNAIEIVLAPIHELRKLKEYRFNKFDVVLMNDAAQISELDTLPALAFEPDAFVLFGDENRVPKDRHGLLKSAVHTPNDMKYLRNILYPMYFYRTIFHRFVTFGTYKNSPSSTKKPSKK